MIKQNTNIDRINRALKLNMFTKIGNETLTIIFISYLHNINIV